MEAKSVYEDGILKLLIYNPGEHAEAVKGAFYHEDGDFYAKEYTGDFQKVDKLMYNFEHLAPLMFEKGDWKKALLFLAETCRKNGIVWFLTGSEKKGKDCCPCLLLISIYCNILPFKKR